MKPLAEAGGWVTPDEGLVLSRSYANGAGVSTGQGGLKRRRLERIRKAGQQWYAGRDDNLAAWAEGGQQAIAFDAYAESYGSANLFPASFDEDVLRFNYVKLGALNDRRTAGERHTDGKLDQAMQIASGSRADGSLEGRRRARFLMSRGTSAHAGAD